MMDTIARTGSFAAAARELGKVPSALTYSVRQLEDALDALLFDRSSRQAQLTRRRCRTAATKAAACCRKWTPWPTGCAGWPAAGRRSWRISVEDLLSVPDPVRAGRSLLPIVHQRGTAARRRMRRHLQHALAPAHGRAEPAPGRRWSRGQVELAIGISGELRQPGWHRVAAAGRECLSCLLRGAAPPAGGGDRSRWKMISWCTTAPWPWPTAAQRLAPDHRQPAARAGRA